MPPQMGSSFAQGQGQGGYYNPSGLRFFGQLLQPASASDDDYNQYCYRPFERETRFSAGAPGYLD